MSSAAHFMSAFGAGVLQTTLLEDRWLYDFASAMQAHIMAAVRHPNIVLFMGLCLNPVCIVTELCARGSLCDVIRKAADSPKFAREFDWSKRLMMALDAAKVMPLCTALLPIGH